MIASLLFMVLVAGCFGLGFGVLLSMLLAGEHPGDSADPFLAPWED